MKEWFEEWFDTKYYHILYKNRNFEDASRLVDSLENKLNFNKDQLFCDLCCGKGRHSMYLNQKGYSVIGLDLSENNIKEASKNKNNRLQFFVHDMREIFETAKFDIILNLFTSFGYFSDDSQNQKAVNAISQSLKPGGLVCIDYLNIPKNESKLNQSYIESIDGIDFRIEKKSQDGFIIKNIRFEDQNQAFEFQERVKIISHENFETYFKKAGLKLEYVFGDYDLNPYEASSSDRLILIGKKTK